MDSPGGKRTIGDAISDKVVVANANCSVGRRYNAGSVLVTYEIHTNILRNALEGTPLDWNRVPYCRQLGEDGIVARSTTAFELLRGVVVDTE